MPYVITMPRGTDLGRFLPAAPAVTGVFAAQPGAVIETVTGSSSASSVMLSFASGATPPSVPATLHIRNNRNGGDLYRSGILSRWPASPATMEVWTAPTALTTFTGAQLSSMARSSAVGSPIPIPVAATIAIGAATGLVFAPSAITITGVVIAPAAPNLLNVTIVGSIAFTQFFFTSATPFTANLSLAVAPSGDPVDRSRIFSVRVLASSLNPGVISPGINAAIAILQPIAAQLFAPLIEGALNNAVLTATVGAVSSVLPGRFLASSTSISAHSVLVDAAGALALQIVVANVGPAFVSLPPPAGTMMFTISPVPKLAVRKTYTVNVTDPSGNGIAGADVLISTPSTTGVSQRFSAQTDATGKARLGPLTLRTFIKRSGPHLSEVDMIEPAISIAKQGFSSIETGLP